MLHVIGYAACAFMVGLLIGQLEVWRLRRKVARVEEDALVADAERRLGGFSTLSPHGAYLALLTQKMRDEVRSNYPHLSPQIEEYIRTSLKDYP